MSVSYSRLPVPVFNLSWVSSTEENEPDRSHILLPGGGGSTKSGIKNQVMIYSINEKKKIEESVFDPPLMTDGLLKLGDKEDKENTSLCVQIIRGYIFVRFFMIILLFYLYFLLLYSFSIGSRNLLLSF